MITNNGWLNDELKPGSFNSSFNAHYFLWQLFINDGTNQNIRISRML